MREKKSGQQAYADEQGWIAERRRRAGQRADGPSRGLALSGGGIRAATVARGFVERLDESGAFARFDYLSTVSGGSYLGGAVTEHMGRLGRALPLPSEDYPLTSPPSHAPVLAAMVAEMVFLFLPLLMYIMLPMMIFTGHEQWYDGPVASGCYVLAGLIAIYGIPPLRRWLMGEDKAQARELLVGCALVALAFLAVLELGPGKVFAGLLLSFGLSLGYLRRNRHIRIEGRSGGAWALWITLFLSCCAAWSFEILGPRRGIVWALAAMALPVIFGILAWSTLGEVDQWNRFGFASRRYRRNIGERFLPFSRWPGGRLLRTLSPGPNPYHIINTTANSGTAKSHFELAALHCGNQKDGYAATSDWLPRLTIEEAVAVSGGAMDLHAFDFGWGSLVSMFAHGTGHWIAARPGDAIRSSLLLAHASLLLKRHQKLAIRLSDGGFTDNLGVLPLLYRRIDRIVCLDNGFDPLFAFDDLQRLCRTASRSGVASIVLHQPEEAIAALKFSAPGAGFLAATIHYPETGSQPAKLGSLLVVKLHACGRVPEGAFDEFPHFSTDDQGLSASDLESLHAVGRALGERAAREPLLAA